jgi:hypothetical protein
MDRAAAEKMLTARLMATAVSEELDWLAAQVWAFGLSEGTRRAIAIVAQMGAELAVAAVQLYGAKCWYAGAALVRQLIEVEYLLFLFATDPTESERWLKASSAEAKNIFSPAAMRQRSAGRFGVEEYQVHLETGGHPSPLSHALLREHLTPIADSTLKLMDCSQWVDLAHHLERLARHYMAAVALHSRTNIYPDRFARLEKLVSDWNAADPTTTDI